MVQRMTTQKTTRGFSDFMPKTVMPLWYCLKTTFNKLTGKIESEIMKDEDTGDVIAIQSEKKPLDGVYESATETIYFTYHDNYAEASRWAATK